jgi:2-keto-3-deoxy-L-rhamnonate aldolase RhmA
LNNLEDIVSVGHIDCIYFGTYDIAVSMGLDDQMDMRVQNAVKDALDKTEGKVNYYGQVSVSKEQRQTLDDRINFIAHGVDCGIALEGFKNNLK